MAFANKKARCAQWAGAGIVALALSAASLTPSTPDPRVLGGGAIGALAGAIAVGVLGGAVACGAALGAIGGAAVGVFVEIEPAKETSRG